MKEFVTPVMRLVQGGMSLQAKMDYETDKPKLNDDGSPQKEVFFAGAIRKDDPLWGAFYADLYNEARAEFPHLVVNGTIQHPKFAFKIKDGDGVDSNGKSLKDKPGHAGCWIVSFGTQFVPKCFHAGKYDPMQQIANVDEVFYRGCYIRVNGIMRGNGVGASDTKKVPGLFLSPANVEFIAHGEKISSGPDAAAAFGAAAPVSLPPGASAVPLGPTPGAVPGLPGLPGATTPPPPAAAGVPGVPPVPGATPGVPPLPGVAGAASVPPPPGVVAPPPVASGPVYQMAAGETATREQYIAGGWNDEMLIAHGKMIRIA